MITVQMNIPGPVKTSPGIRQAFLDLFMLTKERLQCHSSILHEESALLATGPEGMLLMAGKPEDFKVLCMAIEQTHPLGRILDLDVFDENNQPVSRKGFHVKPRKCLVCEEPAKVCSRQRTHSQQLIFSKIECMITQYYQKSHREI